MNFFKKFSVIILCISLISGMICTAGAAEANELTWTMKPRKELKNAQVWSTTEIGTYIYLPSTDGSFSYYIDAYGNPVGPYKKVKGGLEPVNDNYTIVREDYDKYLQDWRIYYVIGKDGNAVIEDGKYTQLKRLNNSLIIASKGGKYGVIDVNENIIIPFEYDLITRIDGNLVSIVKNKLCGVADSAGKIIIPCEHEHEFQKKSDIFLVTKPITGTTYIFDLYGKKLMDCPDVMSFKTFDNVGMTIEYNGKKYDYIDASGKIIDLKQYKDSYFVCNAFDNGYMLGTIASTGEYIITDKNLNPTFTTNNPQFSYYDSGIFEERIYEYINHNDIDAQRVLKSRTYYDMYGNDISDRFSAYNGFSELDKNQFLVYNDDRHMGVIDQYGNMIIEYTDIINIHHVGDGIYYVRTKHGKWGFATLGGNGEKVSDWEDGIKLTIGSTNAKVDGEDMICDAAPIVRNDRTMLPARFVAENLGATVEWDGDTQTVTIKADGYDTIMLTIGSDVARIGSWRTEKLDSPAFVENDRTYTPVRFIAERLGATVEWDEATQTVTIIK